MIRSKHA